MTRNLRRQGLVATVKGTGRPLLLVHGLGSSRHTWQTIIDELSASYQTIAVDLPGHGDSEWPKPAPKAMTPYDHAVRLEPFVEEFGVDGRIDVVGSSMGGWVALELAANQRARSVTAFCPAGLEYEPWVQRSDLLVFRKRLTDLLGPVMPPAVDVIARVPYLRNLLIGDATANFDRLDRRMLSQHAVATRKAAGFYASHDGMLNVLFNRADEIDPSVPISVVWGLQDELLLAQRQRRVAAPSHAKWIVLDECAHVPMWDQPEKSVEIIRATTQARTE